MPLSKEQILTLTTLKEIGVKGIGTQKIFAIANAIESKGIVVDNNESLVELMQNMKEKAIQQVTLDALNTASKYAKQTIEASKEKQIGLIGFYDNEFPEILRQTINEDGKQAPPLLLWYRGDISVAKMPGLAVIGTREATPEGIKAGSFFAEEFAKKGFNIVSGLALGSDTCGHKGALNVGGKTTAFLANGLDYDSIYPTENKDLAEEIVNSGGLLLSEYKIGTSVNPYQLVARDRLQAGLSLATLVIQTSKTGGTMHAARTTQQANKSLYVIKYKDDAVNNHIQCSGNKFLVTQGAKYISSQSNLDEISEHIKNWKPVKTTLF